MNKLFVFPLIAIYLNSLSVNSESVNSSEISNEENDQIKDERVIGGRDALPGEVPYQVALLKEESFTCGGFLIEPNAVVTAAHCVIGAQNTNYKIRYNTLQYNSGPTIDVKKAIVHPFYNPNTNANDIAVLILSSAFISDENAKSIDIFRSLDPHPNTIVTVTGWGRTSVSSNAVSNSLRIANLTVMSRQECNKKWKPFQITNKMICAIDRTRSSCNGDSGGPLVQNGKIVGIVSFGSRECLNSELPNVYTGVKTYVPWINYVKLQNVQNF